LSNDDAMEYSDAVKLTAEIRRKQACGITERTNEMEMSDMTETEREGDTTKDGWEVGPLHEPTKETVAPKKLLASRNAMYRREAFSEKHNINASDAELQSCSKEQAHSMSADCRYRDVIRS
jgi:hypothetical protein